MAEDIVHPGIQKVKIPDLGKVLLETGALLMSSGANSHRIRTTINRIAIAYHYGTELLITHRALTLTLYDEEQDEFFNSIKRTSPHGVNFRMVSGISHMSWKVVEEGWNLDQVREELIRLKALPHYPRLVTLSLVSLAGSAFCFVFGGGSVEMAVAFGATFAGLFTRQEAMKMNFNPYLCVFFAAAVSSLLSGMTVKFGIGSNPEAAFSTSVLYLIPGVPLINSFSDLLDGNIMNGIVRGVNGLIIALAIALGLLVAIVVYQI